MHRFNCYDQTNLVLNSGVRDSLDVTVKHKIVFCKILLRFVRRALTLEANPKLVE